MPIPGRVSVRNSTAIAHAPARTREPVRQGMVAMLGPFVDTIIVCTMTALVIIVSGLHQTSDMTGASLSAGAFAKAMPNFGQHVVSFGLVFFATASHGVSMAA